MKLMDHGHEISFISIYTLYLIDTVFILPVLAVSTVHCKLAVSSFTEETRAAVRPLHLSVSQLMMVIQSSYK